LLSNTSKHYKFLFLLDLDERTDQAITQLLRPSKGTSERPLRVNRHKIKEHIVLFKETDKLSDLSLNKVYLKRIKIGKL